MKIFTEFRINVRFCQGENDPFLENTVVSERTFLERWVPIESEQASTWAEAKEKGMRALRRPDGGNTLERCCYGGCGTKMIMLISFLTSSEVTC